MAYSKFTLAEVVADFQLTANYTTDLFPNAPPVAPSPFLQGVLDEFLPLGLAIGSEKARSEFIIAPLLAELRRHHNPLSLFSGINFDVEPAQGLVGYCDFLLSRSGDPFFVQAPVLMIVEAKKEDIKTGFGQCAASMVGAQRFNQQAPVPVIHGAVTSGEVWRFLRLDGTALYIDREERFLKPIDALLGILVAAIRP